MGRKIENRMLRDKQKYLSSAPKFSTRKQAFKAGWKAGFEYAKKFSSEQNVQESDTTGLNQGTKS